MYPLSMHNPSSAGYAVANTEAEHAALSAAGYLPPLEKANEGQQEEGRREEARVLTPQPDARAALLADAAAAGVKVDKRWGADRIRQALREAA